MLIPLPDLVKKYNTKIKGIVHVGAHELQEKAVYDSLHVNRVVWIDANEDICNRMKTKYPEEKILHAVVADQDDKEVEFILTNNEGQSSSIFELEEHKIQHPWVFETGRTKAKTTRLDTLFADQKIDFKDYNLLNCDVQGAELLVLKGMGEKLNDFDYLYLEVNTKHLYKNCPLLNEIQEYVTAFGFQMKEISMSPHFWGDAFFVKSKCRTENGDDGLIKPEEWVFNGTNTFCISMDAHIETRWKPLSLRFAKDGIEIKRWEASTPDSVTDRMVYYLNPGQRGCAQSHVNIWRYMIEKQSKFCLILEDDAVPRQDWLSILNRAYEEVVSVDPSWDLLMLNASEKSEPVEQWVKAEEQFLTGAYVLSIRGAEWLIEHFGGEFFASDWMVSRLQLRGHSYTYFPWPVIQEGRNTTVNPNGLDGTAADFAKVKHLLASSGITDLNLSYRF